jgi:hypothetical protein
LSRRRKGLGGDRRTKPFMLAPTRKNMMGLVLPSLQRRTSRKMCQGLKIRERRTLLDKILVTSVEKKATTRRILLTFSNS